MISVWKLKNMMIIRTGGWRGGVRYIGKIRGIEYSKIGNGRLFSQFPTRASNSKNTETIDFDSISPESPRYIEVPLPPQYYGPQPTKQEARLRRTRHKVKGTLPVPRNVFRGEDRSRWISPLMLALRTREPDSKLVEKVNSNQDAHDNVAARKQHLAQMRRQNLREGLLELYVRQRIKARKQKRSRIRGQRRREALLYAPERADEKYTRPSEPSNVKEFLKKQVLRSWKYNESLLKKARERYRIHELKRIARAYELVKILYINALNSMVTEEQVRATIDRVFGTDENPNMWDEWNLSSPDSALNLLKRYNRNPALFIGRQSTDNPLGSSSERIREIADALSYGKL